MTAEYIRLFIRANHDVLRTVVGARNSEGALTSVGLRQFKQSGDPQFLVRAEPHTRIDQLVSVLEQRQTIPPWLADVNLGDFPLEQQAGSKLYDGAVDVLILSLQAEVEHVMWRHLQSGALYYLGTDLWRRRTWSPQAREKLTSHFECVERLAAMQWAEQFDRFLSHLRVRRDCAVVLFTGEVPRVRPPIHDYSGAAAESEVWLRNNQFQEAAIQIAGRHEVTIMNASAILVGLGTDCNVVAPFRYGPEGYAALGEHLYRVLVDLIAASRPHGG